MISQSTILTQKYSTASNCKNWLVKLAIYWPVRVCGHETELMRWGELIQRFWQLTVSKHIQPPTHPPVR